MILKRTIILCNKNERYNKAVAFVNIQREGIKTQAILKCYNLQGFASLVFGICEDNHQLIKSQFKPSSSETVFDIHTNFDINGNLGCVIVEETPDGAMPILWGKNDCLDVLFPSEKSFDRDEKGRFVGKKKEELFEEPTEEELDKLITQELFKEDIVVESVAVEEPVVENEIKAEELRDEEEPKKEIKFETPDPETFYALISEQVEELFNKYPEEDRLEKLVPHSKWVKVDYEGKGKEYAVGLVYDGDVLKYLAYGVPSSKDAEIQNEIKEYSQWIPLDPTSLDGKGFWVMYQDAITGDSVNVLSKELNFA